MLLSCHFSLLHQLMKSTMYFLHLHWKIAHSVDAILLSVGLQPKQNYSYFSLIKFKITVYLYTMIYFN